MTRNELNAPETVDGKMTDEAVLRTVGESRQNDVLGGQVPVDPIPPDKDPQIERKPDDKRFNFPEPGTETPPVTDPQRKIDDLDNPPILPRD